MKRLIIVVATLSLLIPFMESCKPTVVDLAKYADKIEAQLKNQTFGYAFVVSRPGEASVARAGGEARRSQDPPPKKMSVDVKYTMASVSKNITAAAFLKLLDDTNIKDLSLGDKLDEKIVGYLPYNWKPGAGVDTITFRELLRHRAGIRCKDNVDYQSLRQCLAQKIDVADKQKDCSGNSIGNNQIGCYNNVNYALFRIIISVMLGKIKPLTSQGSPSGKGSPLDKAFKDAVEEVFDVVVEQQNAALAADVYIKYVNDNVFAKAGLPQIFCRPTDDAQQGLSYKHVTPEPNGTDFGNDTLGCGSEGWFLSASQMATYFQALNTGKLGSPAIPVRMRDELLGYDGSAQFDSPDGKITRWWKPGGHPAAQNPGEINTYLLHFSNGVELSLIMNSDMLNGFDYGAAVTNAMSDVLNGK